MVSKTNGRRPVAGSTLRARTLHRPKLLPRQPHQMHGKPTHREKERGKERSFDRRVIQIPIAGLGEDVELSDQDLEVFDAYGGAAAFLGSLDQKGIARSKKESDRLHRLTKPLHRAPVDVNLPSINARDDDEDSLDSELDPDTLSYSDSGEDDQHPRSDPDSDVEMPYEAAPRNRRPPWEPKEERIQQLPIKLSNGRIQQTGSKVIAKDQADESDEEPATEQFEWDESIQVDDVSTGARFGRPAVVDVITNTSRTERIQGAKEQIASICREIVSEPENGLGLLRRLHTFALAELSSPSHPDPVPNDPVIQKLAVVSQLAVFKDIIPGYRVRALTDREKAEKVSQMVTRTREWEQGLVLVYQSYLRSLEAELKAKSELSPVALYCMCTLACEVTHFNFRVNLLTCIVARLSKKSWDTSSDLCLNTLIRIFRADLTGAVSLEVVRLLHRMIKEKRFNVQPEVLSCLLHLRLKTELGVRASMSKTDKDDAPKAHSKGKAAARRAKGKPTDRPHLSKMGKKVSEEKKHIEREFREAEAEIDKEEKDVTQTETLKLLFVLYFRILKNPDPTPLLPAALQGISKYAHLVNIDFFKDLMKVLKELISRESGSAQDVDGTQGMKDIQQRLLCIVTAFELLSGQGEAINIDLNEFISRLYAIILPLSYVPDIDTPPRLSFTPDVHGVKRSSVADMLFRALNIIFSPRNCGAAAPPWRSAAFAKRLLTASLHWPPTTALRVIEFVGGMIAKDAKLETLLSTDDRSFNGVYRPDVDDPQLCNPFGTSFWELHVLQQQHWDVKVREAAKELANFSR